MYTLATLPDAVKNLPTQELREAWMKAYNSASTQYKGDEAKANATAWATIKKMGYVKKDDKWVKMEAEIYKKDLLIAGSYPHPQHPEKKVNMTIERLNDIAIGTTKYLNAGGKIPITISHPKSEEEKIDTTQGWLNKVWVDAETKRLFGELQINSEKSEQWIKDGKLQAVSPGVYHDVVTSAGKIPVFIDHVALTGSPHNLGQFGFLPMNAESFSSAEIFFENHCVSYQAGGDVDDKNKTLLQNASKGGMMEALQKLFKLLDGIKSELIKLFVGVKQPGEPGYVAPGTEPGGSGTTVPPVGIAQQGPKIGQSAGGGLSAEAQKTFDTLLLERDTLEKKIKTLEDAEKKRTEDEKKATRTKFEARLDEDISIGLIKPANRSAIVAEYETLIDLGKINFEGKDISIEDYILSRYEGDKESKLKTTLQIDLNHFTFENKQYDINTDEGREALYQLKLSRAKELAKGIEGKTHIDLFEQADKEIEEELFGAKE